VAILSEIQVALFSKWLVKISPKDKPINPTLLGGSPKWVVVESIYMVDTGNRFASSEDAEHQILTQ